MNNVTIKHREKLKYVSEELSEYIGTVIKKPYSCSHSFFSYFDIRQVNPAWKEYKKLKWYTKEYWTVLRPEKYLTVLTTNGDVDNQDLFEITIYHPIPKELFEEVLGVVKEHYKEVTIELKYPRELDEELIE